MGPNPNKYYFRDNEITAPVLVGLLGLADTRELGVWLDSRPVREVWKGYKGTGRGRCGGCGESDTGRAEGVHEPLG